MIWVKTDHSLQVDFVFKGNICVIRSFNRDKIGICTRKVRSYVNIVSNGDITLSRLRKFARCFHKNKKSYFYVAGDFLMLLRKTRKRNNNSYARGSSASHELQRSQ